MIKTAIFVEGLTEREFIKKLIYKRYGNRPVLVREMVMKGKNRYFESLEGKYLGIELLVFLVEVPDYTSVATMIMKNAEEMVMKKGFAEVIGLRDLSPNRRSEKAKVIETIDRLLRRMTVYDKIGIYLAVMEMEAWCMCDWDMFRRIDNRLIPKHLENSLNIDVVNGDPEEDYGRPHVVMDKILRLVNLRYRKHEEEIKRMVENTDFDYLGRVNNKVDSFIKFRNRLDNCLKYKS